MSDCFCCAKFRLQFCESCGATYRRICEMISALQSTIWSHNRCRKQRPNLCILGDAIHPQTGTKLTKNVVLNLVLLSRHLTPQRTRSSADADNRLDAFSGQSRSTNMVPFHMLHIVSYCAIVTLSLRQYILSIY